MRGITMTFFDDYMRETRNNLIQLVPKCVQKQGLVRHIASLAFSQFMSILSGKECRFWCPMVHFGTQPPRMSESGMRIFRSALSQNVCYSIHVFVWNQLSAIYYLFFSPACKGSAQRSGTAALYGPICGQYCFLITFNVREFVRLLGRDHPPCGIQVSSIMTTTGFASTDFLICGPGFGRQCCCAW